MTPLPSHRRRHDRTRETGLPFPTAAGSDSRLRSALRGLSDPYDRKVLTSPPAERLAILALRAARGWTVASSTKHDTEGR